jgi:hypothetical protein
LGNCSAQKPLRGDVGSGITLVIAMNSYDFATGLAQTFGGVNAHKQLAAGKWGMFSGD